MKSKQNIFIVHEINFIKSTAKNEYECAKLRVSKNSLEFHV